jgi:hypothetical protein
MGEGVCCERDEKQSGGETEETAETSLRDDGMLPLGMWLLVVWSYFTAAEE